MRSRGDIQFRDSACRNAAMPKLDRLSVALRETLSKSAAKFFKFGRIQLRRSTAGILNELT